MKDVDEREAELLARIRQLEAENEILRQSPFASSGTMPASVPPAVRPLFEAAADTVASYFSTFSANPGRGTVEIGDERYLLLRAESLSYGFLDAVRTLYADRGAEEALRIGKTLLFDMAHVIGASDARHFNARTGTMDPIAKLAAGPIHFAYTGWAFVEMLPDCRPTQDDDFYLHYHHPFSFESYSWIRAGRKTDFPVCVMNAGYSSGWCEESFGIALSATEIACKAMGDEHCTFVMAPPERLSDYVTQALAGASDEVRARAIREIPTLFERKVVEEKLKAAVQSAEAANEAKSRFLANMSHELRTPLTGILGMAELLLRTDLDDRTRGQIETIDESGKALLAILNDILDISKVDAGMMTIEPRPCDVRSVVDDVIRMLHAPALDRGLELDVQIDARLPGRVRADPVRLRQVLLNLAGNAVKFTEQGHVHVRAGWQPPNRLVLEVEDTGIGIPKERIQEIFEDFTQVDSSTTRRHGGTGLGLGITRRFVALMGGRIGAQSEVGRGSTFRVELPVESVADVDRPMEEAASSSVRPGARVLLVEDNRVARFVVEALLRELGVEVEAVTDGRQAVEAVESGRYDLVLMDCHMPVLDGYEATRTIRAREKQGQHLPILAMTASVMPEDSQRCTEAGMDDFLAKPLDPEKLEEALARWAPTPPSS